MKNLIFILLIGFTFTSCSKDQKIVNYLEGTWQYHKVLVNGIDETLHYSGSKIEYEKCKLNKDSWCDAILTYSDPKWGTHHFAFEFQIIDKGETYREKWVDGFEVHLIEADIKNHSKDRFEYSFTDSDYYEYWDDEKEEWVIEFETNFIEITLRKID